MRIAVAVAVVGLLLTASCTSGEATSSAVTSPGGSPVSTPTGRPSDTESFVTALGSAGYKVKVGPIEHPPGFGGFEMRAERVTIDGFSTWAFEFPTVSAYERMRSSISDDGQRIGGATFVWHPHIYGSGRLIVLSVGNLPSPARRALNELFGRQFAGV